MSMNIVVLTGSPRKDGNTFALVDAFIGAAEKKGHKIVRFDTAFMNVGGCRACSACYSSGAACVEEDDFNTVAPALEAADAVVFAMPVYWYAMPAQLKAVMDKVFALVVGERKTAGKKCALIACCEERDMATFTGLCDSFNRAMGFLKWDSVGEVLGPGVLNPGDVSRTDGCVRAAALADKF